MNRSNKNNVYLKTQPFFKHHYTIYYGNTEIGEITFIKQNKILIITFLGLFVEYRKQHYGYQVIEYLLSHYKVNCIIGETLETSRGFWHKCIVKYNGQRRNIFFHNNCTSSFVIPKYKISNEKIYRLLENFQWY